MRSLHHHKKRKRLEMTEESHKKKEEYCRKLTLDMSKNWETREKQKDKRKNVNV